MDRSIGLTLMSCVSDSVENAAPKVCVALAVLPRNPKTGGNTACQPETKSYLRSVCCCDLSKVSNRS